MAHTPYHFDWNQTPAGGQPPASTSSPNAFLRDFSNVNISGLDDTAKIFLPDTGQMVNNIAMARQNFNNNAYAQQLAGQNNLFNMTGGMGLNSMSEGFGRRQSNITSGLRNLNQQYQTGLQQNMASFRADVLGEQFKYQDALTGAISNLIQSGEYEDLQISPYEANDALKRRRRNYEGWNPPGYTGTPTEGEVFQVGDTQWTFSNGQWV